MVRKENVNGRRSGTYAEQREGQKINVNQPNRMESGRSRMDPSVAATKYANSKIKSNTKIPIKINQCNGREKKKVAKCYVTNLKVKIKWDAGPNGSGDGDDGRRRR